MKNKATHLQKITARAKQIRKAKPSMKWTDAISKASAELKTGKPAPKKVGSVKTSSKKHTDKNRITANIQVGATSKKTASVNSSISNLRIYGDMVKRVAQLEKEIAVMRSSKSKAPANLKAGFDRVIKSLQKELEVARKQRSAQKTLI